LVIFRYNWKIERLNYLGHLFFSDDNHELMLGNLMGDFVKGSRMVGIHKSLHAGIYLHRRIDQYIDSHSAVLELNRMLYAKLPRVSSITIDIVFDHLLANNWKMYHKQDLNIFLNNFFSFSKEHKSILPVHYSNLLSRLEEHQMLHRYIEEETIDRIAGHLQNRLSFDTNLHDSRRIFHEYHDEFNNAFHTYMGDAVNIFLEKK